MIQDIDKLLDVSALTTIARGEKSENFAIPKENLSVAGDSSSKDLSNPKGHRIFALNEEILTVLREETLQVQSVLAGIFVETEPNQTPPLVETPQSPMEELDENHQFLLKRLAVNENWDRKSLQAICKEYGLMTDGAIETLNEWSFRNANSPLIEDGEPIFVDINLVQEILNVR